MEMSSHFNTTFSVRHVLILRMCQGTKISSFAQVKFHHMVVVGGKSRALAVTNLKERGKKKKGRELSGQSPVNQKRVET